MCSIFGYYSKKWQKAYIIEGTKRALEITKYRGPDFSDYLYFDKLNLALGHNRLSIIDLSPKANQPMGTEDKSLWIVFNGEIYNYLEIREDLINKGYRFFSKSDTEVILKAYKEYGYEFVKKFDGMFAFCLLDLQKRKLILARDIAGEKPLFYYFDGKNFIFSSELKQILIQQIRPIFDFSKVNFYFALGYLPHDMSFFKNTYKLPPAHMMIFDFESNSLHLQPFWEIPSFEKSMPEKELMESISEILKKSVKRRMISDVPLGAFLSGGIDSSLTVYFMKEAGAQKIKTFTVGFEGSSKNETEYAKIVANSLGTDHTEIIIEPDFEKALEEIADTIDEPIYDSSLIPTYYLCKYVKHYVTVALSGDGGDELFAGYIHYLSSKLCSKLSQYMPCFLRKIFYFMGSFLPEGYFGKNTLMGIGEGNYGCYTNQTQIFKEGERKKLIPYLNEHETPLRLKKALMEKYRGDFINKMSYADYHINLQQILVKVDRASMMNSLEVRTPFLNKDLIELSFRNISGDLKLKENKTKYMLKKLAKSKFPPNFPVDRKQGFDIPKDFLVKTNLMAKLKELPHVNFLNEKYITNLLVLQQKGKGNLWNKLFAIYFFKRWYLKWIE